MLDVGNTLLVRKRVDGRSLEDGWVVSEHAQAGITAAAERIAWNIGAVAMVGD